jgi:putative membrane protein
MLFETLLALITGILFGTFTGLIPGIHINLIGAFLISLSTSVFYQINPIYLVVFISSMAITHTFLDFIPSILLGCPDTDTELSVLPGHELLKQGHGYEAIILTAYGSVAAIILLILIAFPSVLLISNTYYSIKNLIPYFLILISIILICLEKQKIKSIFVFLLTGLLGLAVLNLQMNQPLLPLLTGLFGSSMLITSIKNKVKIPEQKIPKKIKTNILRPLLGALIASPLCSFLPGLGSGQAAIIGNTISRTDRKGFLVLLGATNTLVMGFSFLSLYTISKTRTGAAVAIQQILGTLSYKTLILILIVSLTSGIISFFLTIFLAKNISKKLNRFNYTFISSLTLITLIIIILLVSGIIGLFVLITSTLTGIYCISLKVRRTNMMGCLLLPVILFFTVF